MKKFSMKLNEIDYTRDSACLYRHRQAESRIPAPE